MNRYKLFTGVLACMSVYPAFAADARLEGCWQLAHVADAQTDGRQVEVPGTDKRLCTLMIDKSEIMETCLDKQSNKVRTVRKSYSASGKDTSPFGLNDFKSTSVEVDGKADTSKVLTGIYNVGNGTLSIQIPIPNGATRVSGYLRKSPNSCSANGSNAPAMHQAQRSVETIPANPPLPAVRVLEECSSNLRSATDLHGGFKQVNKLEFAKPIAARELNFPIKGAANTLVYPVKFSFVRESGQPSWSSFFVYADPFGALICVGG